MAKKSSRDSKQAKPGRNAKRGAEDLLTGSLASADLRARSVEEEIGTEVRRLRKGLDLTVSGSSSLESPRAEAINRVKGTG